MFADRFEKILLIILARRDVSSYASLFTPQNLTNFEQRSLHSNIFPKLIKINQKQTLLKGRESTKTCTAQQLKIQWDEIT